MGNLKDTIRNNFWGNYFISCYHCIQCKIMPAVISDEKAVKKFYYKKTGKELDLENPNTFLEKLNWYKLYGKQPLMQQCADKVDVRKYIDEKGYSEYLNTVYGVYSKVKDIDYDSLPNEFVIKAAHGSSMNYIVRNKDDFDWKHAKKMLNSWLHQDIYWSGREWVYKDIPKRLIIEKYLEDETGELTDYKFFCFNGKPAFMQYDMNRYDNHRRNYYDMDFNLLPFMNRIERDTERNVSKPECFDEMKRCATDLSETFQFARIDFYQVNGKVYFGEITFYPTGGSVAFEPEEYEKIIGNMWNLVR